MSREVVYFTRQLPGLFDELSNAGFAVHECLAISEVFEVCERLTITTVVIDSSVEDRAAYEVASRYVSLRLTPEARIRDIVWELSSLFPESRLQ